MSDDLDDLKSAFGAATPAPDSARRAENLALAQKNFEALQGSRQAARPTPVTAPSGLWTGLKAMLTSMTSRGALGATTALVACGFLVLTDTGQGLWLEGDFSAGSSTEKGLAGQIEDEPGEAGGLMVPTTIRTGNEAEDDTRAIEEARAATEAFLAESADAATTPLPEAAPEPMIVTSEGVASDGPASPFDLSMGSAVADESTVDPSLTEGTDLADAFAAQDTLASEFTRDPEQARAEQPDLEIDGAMFELETRDDESLFFGDDIARTEGWVSAGDMETAGAAPAAPTSQGESRPEAGELPQTILRGDLAFDSSGIVEYQSRRLSQPSTDEEDFFWEGNLSVNDTATLDNGLPAEEYFEISPDSEPVVNLEAYDESAEIGSQTTPNTEAFANEPPASLKITQETPVSTFSIDVDTASYSLLRSSITNGLLPPPESVRIEELINYFPFDYPAPDTGEVPFRPTVSTMQTPWNADTQLVHIAIQGQMPLIEDRPPLNLVFLIDTSGSMNQPNKLPLLKQSFRLMLAQLRPEDQVAIVAYAGSAGQVLEPTSAADQNAIIGALDGLASGGSTNGQGGLQQAYSVAESMKAEGEVNRIILATDGDFNVGINNPDALKDFIADKRDTGTYLSVLGFGRGNLDDATMQALAQNGNGTAAYIDTLTEAQKVLVDQLTGALFPIAGDVKIQVEWNPAEVAEYRLIGYETRALAREDFNNDKVDAGELGAGHSVTAIYEVTPVGSPAQLSDPLRYAPTQAAEGNGELGFLKLRYKDPGATESQLLTTPIVPTQGASSDAQFAVAIAGFGQLLRDDRFLGDWNYPDAIALANASRGDDPFGYRTEAVQLMRLAYSLSGNRLGR